MAGEVQSWGRNQNGQLGFGTTEDSLLPQKIQAFEVKKSICQNLHIGRSTSY